MAKSDKQKRYEELTAIFKGMPIDKWSAYIDANAGEERRLYRVCAKRALSLENMKAYIVAHDNTKEARKKFKDSTWGIQYVKVEVPTNNGETKKVFKLDSKGEKVPMVDEKGEVVKKQSIVYAVSYFTKTYLDGLLLIEKEEKEPAFASLEDW